MKMGVSSQQLFEKATSYLVFFKEFANFFPSNIISEKLMKIGLMEFRNFENKHRLHNYLIILQSNLLKQPPLEEDHLPKVSNVEFPRTNSCKTVPL